MTERQKEIVTQLLGNTETQIWDADKQADLLWEILKIEIEGDHE